MGFTARLSVLIALLAAFAAGVMLIGSAVSFFYYSRQCYWQATVAVPLALALVALAAWSAVRWLRRQTAGQERLEARAQRILFGERDGVLPGAGAEWPANASGALDRLLADLAEACEEQGRVDTLIRAFAAQDAETGLNNRLFFDHQLTLQLEGDEDVGTHGVVMMIRLPDFGILRETHGGLEELEEFRLALVNLLAAAARRDASAMLARYYHHDFTVLLPHRTLKEAEHMAAQLVKSVDILPVTPFVNHQDMLHIGICAYRGGQTLEQVMGCVEAATRNAALQGGNGWNVYDRPASSNGRGSVRWRTLLEQTLQRGGPRLYHKPAFTREGAVHHHELSCRIFDGDQELLEAEFMPLVKQLGLAASYDRLLVTRALELSERWPDATLALPISVDSLLQQPFLDWLHDRLAQCPPERRQRILFELAEADVCQYTGRLRPVFGQIAALGCRLAVIQAGLTLVSASYLRALPMELVKLHPCLVHNLTQRVDNQLFVRSLTEVCKAGATQVFAVGVKSAEVWRTLLEHGVRGGQGELFVASEPVGNTLKKYSPRTDV